jgi:hypothetical protein
MTAVRGEVEYMEILTTGREYALMFLTKSIQEVL